MNTLLILDEASGDEVQRCSGPAGDGSCPRVNIGDILPCAGHALRPADAGAGQRRYSVSAQATLCPVTIAAALAVIRDTRLTRYE
jgi:hypothetical protein